MQCWKFFFWWQFELENTFLNCFMPLLYFSYTAFSCSMAVHVSIFYLWSRHHSFPQERINVSCCIWKFTTHYCSFCPISYDSWVGYCSYRSLKHVVPLFSKQSLYWFDSVCKQDVHSNCFASKLAVLRVTAPEQSETISIFCSNRNDACVSFTYVFFGREQIASGLC